MPGTDAPSGFVKMKVRDDVGRDSALSVQKQAGVVPVRLVRNNKRKKKNMRRTFAALFASKHIETDREEVRVKMGWEGVEPPWSC
jgi:hypothetical protein